MVPAMLKTHVRTCRRYNTAPVQETCPGRCVISKLETDIDQHAHTEAMAGRFFKVLYIGSLTRKGRLTTFLRLHQRRGDIPMWSPKPHSYTWILPWALPALAYPANAHIHIYTHMKQVDKEQRQLRRPYLFVISSDTTGWAPIFSKWSYSIMHTTTKTIPACMMI
jgi:hypothetical protein